MLDVLTYQKGGSVLRMLEQFLGPTSSEMASGATCGPTPTPTP